MVIDIMLALIYLFLFGFWLSTCVVNADVESNSAWFHQPNTRNDLSHQEHLLIARECFQHLPQAQYNLVFEENNDIHVKLMIIKQNWIVYVSSAIPDTSQNVCNVSSVDQTENSFNFFPGCIGHNFYATANYLYVRSIKELSDLLAYSHYPVTFIGHYRGGSLAYVLAAMVKQYQPKINIKNVISVGSSMPGNNEFMKHVCVEQNIHCSSYVHVDDTRFNTADTEFLNQGISEYRYSYETLTKQVQIHQICRGICSSSVSTQSHQNVNTLYQIKNCL